MKIKNQQKKHRHGDIIHEDLLSTQSIDSEIVIIQTVVIYQFLRKKWLIKEIKKEPFEETIGLPLTERSKTDDTKQTR